MLGGKVDVMAKIALISCCSTKQKVIYPNTIQAELLYKSALFKKAMKYAKERIMADKIYILSAEYKLVHLEQQLSWYDKTLNKQKQAEIKAWSEEVRSQLRAEGVDFANDEIFILAGKNYYKYLITEEFQNVRYVYQNMRIGQILHFLSE